MNLMSKIVYWWYLLKHEIEYFLRNHKCIQRKYLFQIGDTVGLSNSAIILNPSCYISDVKYFIRNTSEYKNLSYCLRPQDDVWYVSELCKYNYNNIYKLTNPRLRKHMLIRECDLYSLGLHYHKNLSNIKKQAKKHEICSF